jgi:hypothetical protein
MRPLRRLTARPAAVPAFSAVRGGKAAETLAEADSDLLLGGAVPAAVSAGQQIGQQPDSGPLLTGSPSNHAGLSPCTAEKAETAGDGVPANDDGDPLEPVGVLLDDDGDPALPCATCGGRGFHQAPGDRWRCSGCEPPTLPSDASALARWSFCALPPEDPEQDAPPAPRGDAPERDPAPTRPDDEPPRPDARPGGFPAPEADEPPDPRTAPIGKCRRCGWSTPLSGRGMCWRCAVEGRS